MQITRTASLVISLIFFVLFSVNDTVAQHFRSQNNILGWADDNNYLVSDIDKDSDRIVMSVNVKSGKKKVYTGFSDTRREFLDNLPEGFTIGYGVQIDKDQKTIVLTKDNDLWSFTLGDTEAKRLTNDEVQEINPAMSPTAGKVAYTKEKDLYVYDFSSGKATRLTFDGDEKIYNGYASWVYMEEILGRGTRYSAFWWAPDGKKIAYLHTDDNPVPEFIINRIDEEDGIHGTQEIVPYPKPGDANPIVKMGIVDVNTAKTVWVNTDDKIDQYIAWPNWTVDSKRLMIQVLNRDQNDMKFILADIETGDFKEIYHEKNNTWVDFFSDIYLFENGSGFIVRSYKSGWYNLYYYDWDGILKSQVTDFDWRVTGITRVDEKKGVLYFTGSGGESTERHLFKVGLDGKGLVRYTTEPGSHSPAISPGGKYLIDIWSNIDRPSATTAFDRHGRKVRDIELPEKVEFDASKHARRELVRIPSTDGFMLPAIITYPVNFDENKKYPVVFTIYGGPDSGGVRNSNRGNRASWFAKNNIITISVDHRSSGHFGKKGLDYMYRNLGKWEMVDYFEVVKWLREKPFVDGSRMGITGGSYGGYATAMALTAGADYWTHGIANYSVTDWRLYDNVYTERFMDTPEDNPEGYEAGSVLTYAGKLKGKLYIVHGMADDNVHMQNSIYLISRLQDLEKEFDFMIYAGGRHGWGGAKATHHRNAQNKYWLKWFFGEE
ncbi:MAG: S9 family peptidase [Bacteroidales bacterium]|nr:S9 family peptidase [Bacteroidales bacterium]